MREQGSLQSTGRSYDVRQGWILLCALAIGVWDRLGARVGVICVAAAMPFVFVGEASADHFGGPEPLQVTDTSPTDGAAIEQTDDGVPFSATVIRDPQPPYVVLKVSRDSTPEHYGFLETGSASVHMPQSTTDPTRYESDGPVYDRAFVEAPATAYWQLALSGGSLGYATSPVYSLSITAKPPFLSNPDVVDAIKSIIALETGAKVEALKKKCKRKSDTVVDCAATFRTAKKQKKFSYAGTFKTKLTDGPSIRDEFVLSFTGERAETSCVKEASFDDCAKRLKPWSKDYETSG